MKPKPFHDYFRSRRIQVFQLLSLSALCAFLNLEATEPKANPSKSRNPRADQKQSSLEREETPIAQANQLNADAQDLLKAAQAAEPEKSTPTETEKIKVIEAPPETSETLPIEKPPQNIAPKAAPLTPPTRLKPPPKKEVDPEAPAQPPGSPTALAPKTAPLPPIAQEKKVLVEAIPAKPSATPTEPTQKPAVEITRDQTPKVATTPEPAPKPLVESELAPEPKPVPVSKPPPETKAIVESAPVIESKPVAQSKPAPAPEPVVEAKKLPAPAKPESPLPLAIEAPSKHKPVEIQRSELEKLLEKKQPKPVRSEEALLAVLKTDATKTEKKTALLELAQLAASANQNVKAQQIYSLFLQKFPDDENVPLVLLQQGLLYRKIGSNIQALSKFYSVMTAAINLKPEHIEHYETLVLQAKAEIAETYYLQGQFAESSDFFGRLLKMELGPTPKREYTYKLIRSLYYQNQLSEVVGKSQQFIHDYPEAAELAEVRFILADALKKNGRNKESLEQVLALLQSQQATSVSNPENWMYWQRRTGNDIANRLYKEGDFVNALEIYTNLLTLDASPGWQLPVLYQVGLVYERLEQPQKAFQTYEKILSQQQSLSAEQNTASLKSLAEMAKWRKDSLKWQTQVHEKSLKLTEMHKSSPRK